MYTMKKGNVVRVVDSEAKRDKFIAYGFEEVKGQEPETPSAGASASGLKPSSSNLKPSTSKKGGGE